MLSDLGLNLSLAYSDDLSRDESLLYKCFSNLRNGNEDTTIEEIVPIDLTAMTTQKTILYVYSLQEVLHMLSWFCTDIEKAINDTARSQVKISFNVEWPVFLKVVSTTEWVISI